MSDNIAPGIFYVHDSDSLSHYFWIDLRAYIIKSGSLRPRVQLSAIWMSSRGRIYSNVSYISLFSRLLKIFLYKTTSPHSEVNPRATGEIKPINTVVGIA